MTDFQKKLWLKNHISTPSWDYVLIKDAGGNIRIAKIQRQASGESQFRLVVSETTVAAETINALENDLSQLLEAIAERRIYTVEEIEAFNSEVKE